MEHVRYPVLHNRFLFGGWQFAMDDLNSKPRPLRKVNVITLELICTFCLVYNLYGPYGACYLYLPVYVGAIPIFNHV